MNNGGLNVAPQQQQERIVVTLTAVPSSTSTSSHVELQSEIRPPPIVHAIGGTIGSALSILLCYPLERIRVEMMKSATVAAAAATSSSSPPQLVLTTVESSSSASKAKGTYNIADERQPTENTSLSSSSSSSSSFSSFIAIETPSSYENLSEASTGSSSSSNTSIVSIRPIAVAVASDTMDLYRNDNDSSSPSAMSLSSEGEEQEQVSSSLRNELIPKLKNDENNDGLSSSATSWNFEQNDKINFSTLINTTYPSPFSNTWTCFLYLCKKQELYTGVVPAICTLAISNFIYFYAHEILRQWLLPIPMVGSSTTSSSNNINHSTNTDGLSTINTTVSTTTITTTTSSSSRNSTSSFDYTSEILDNATVAAVRRIVSTLSTIITTTRNNITTKEADNHTASGDRRNEMTSRDVFIRSFLASAAAGIINVLLTNPLWVANLRIIQNTSSSYDTIGNSHTSSSSANHGQQQYRQRSLLSEVLHIIKHEGIAKLWSGTLTSLLLVSNPAINHFLYEQLRNYILLRARMNLHLRSSSDKHYCPHSASSASTPQLRPWETFVLGAFTKAVATVVTYPLQLAQVVIRVQASKESRRHITTTNNLPPPPHNESCGGVTYKGTWDCISSLYRKGGWAALYVGMDAKLLQTVLTAAFTFVTYEQILSLVRRGYRTARLLSK